VTCIRPLLSPQRLEGDVLQAADFRLQKPQVHESLAPVVLARHVVDRGADDREDRYTPAVGAAHLDCLELAATHEPEGAEEEVVGLEHWLPPVDCGRRGGLAFATGRGEPALLYSRAGVGAILQDRPDVGSPCLSPVETAARRSSCQEGRA
jgi:hypothetical protein